MHCRVNLHTQTPEQHLDSKAAKRAQHLWEYVLQNLAADTSQVSKVRIVNSDVVQGEAAHPDA